MSGQLHSAHAANKESLIRQAFAVCEQNLESLGTYPHMEEWHACVRNYYAPETLMQAKPKVIVCGTNFPMELVYALTGQPPYWLTGGNHVFTAASDELVPRDTDPVSRAALGQLLVMEQAKEDALVVIPCASDAQRKIAYTLRACGWKVVTVWIPAVKDAASEQGFLSELEHAVRVLSKHVGKRYSAAALQRAMQSMNAVRASIRSFLQAARGREELLSGKQRMLICDSFFLASDVAAWQAQLERLTAALEKQPRHDQPRVLLAGSPIVFSNFKIPSLLADAGLEISGTVDLRSGQYTHAFEPQPQKGLAALAHAYFMQDASSAFVWNDELQRQLRCCVEETQPDGVIWHVLKGQVEYDFELNRCERYLEEQCLPLIRLETDYQYQDVEQLRIRIEAFAELLMQKRAEQKSSSARENMRTTNTKGDDTCRT